MLPTIVIAERHWDKVPKRVLQSAIPKLNRLGYDTLSFEFPVSMSEESYVNMLQNSMDDLQGQLTDAKPFVERAGKSLDDLFNMPFEELMGFLRSYVTSKYLYMFANGIVHYPSQAMLKEIIDESFALGFCLKGLDINDIETYRDLCTVRDNELRSNKINSTLDDRNEAIFNNTLKLHAEQQGTILSIGFLHILPLIENIYNKQPSLLDEFIFIVPYSEKSIFIDANDTPILYSEHLTISHFSKNPDESIDDIVDELEQMVLDRINGSYLEQPTIVTDYLNTILDANFISYCGNHSFVAAIFPLSVTEEGKEHSTVNEVNDLGLECRSCLFNGKQHAVVRNVNTKQIGTKIQEAYIDHSTRPT